MNDFQECYDCAKKTGSPILCPSCRHNRDVISRLSGNAETLARALQKFAPDLMTELLDRHRAADRAFTDFLAYMRRA